MKSFNTFLALAEKNAFLPVGLSVTGYLGSVERNLKLVSTDIVKKSLLKFLYRISACNKSSLIDHFLPVCFSLFTMEL